MVYSEYERLANALKVLLDALVECECDENENGYYKCPKCEAIKILNREEDR